MEATKEIKILLYVIIVLLGVQFGFTFKKLNMMDDDIIKAKSGDQTMVVLNHIKFDKKDEFNNILFDEVMPAYYAYEDSIEEKNELNDMAGESMRILLPENMNQDSTWTFIMLADPYYDGALYNIGPPLYQKYGATMDDVIKCTCMLADIEDWGLMSEEYIKFFPNHKPARSTFAGSGLALGARVEIECMAKIR